MIRKMIAVQLVVAAAAFAGPSVVERAPALPSQFSCGAGTVRTQRGDQFACADSKGLLHGDAILLNKQGGIESVGKFEHGLRVGTWTHFDKNGVKEGSTQFVGDNFHGSRVFYFPSGQVKTVENWSGGKLDSRVNYDAAGQPVESDKKTN